MDPEIVIKIPPVAEPVAIIDPPVTVLAAPTLTENVDDIIAVVEAVKQLDNSEVDLKAVTQRLNGIETTLRELGVAVALLTVVEEVEKIEEVEEVEENPIVEELVTEEIPQEILTTETPELVESRNRRSRYFI